MSSSEPDREHRRPERERETGRAASRDDSPWPESVECPWCGSTDTWLHAPFGGMLSVSQYYCRNCRTVFDWMKWERHTAP